MSPMKRKLHDDKVDYINDLYIVKGYTMTEVIRKLKVGRTPFKRFCRKHGIVKNPNKNNKNSVPDDELKIKIRTLVEKLGASAGSRELGKALVKEFSISISRPRMMKLVKEMYPVEVASRRAVTNPNARLPERVSDRGSTHETNAEARQEAAPPMMDAVLRSTG